MSLEKWEKLRITAGHMIFWAALTIELLRSSFCFAFSVPGWYESILKLMILMLLLKIAITKYTRKEWIIAALFVLWGWLAHRMSADWAIFRVLMLLIASKDMDRKKILRYSFYFLVSAIIIIFIAGCMGVNGNYLSLTQDYGRNVGTEKRYTFGYGHPNSITLVINSAVMLGLYLYWDKLKWYHFLLIGVLEHVLLATVASRTGYLVGMFILLAAVILKYVPEKKLGRLPVIAGEMCVFASVALSVLGMNYIVLEKIFVIRKANEILNQRLLAAQLSRLNNTFSLFGLPKQKMYDIGLVSMLYRQGALFTLCYIILVCFLIWRLYKMGDKAGFVLVLGWVLTNTVEAYSVPYATHNGTWLLLMGYWSEIFKFGNSEQQQAFWNQEVFSWRFIRVSGKS